LRSERITRIGPVSPREDMDFDEAVEEATATFRRAMRRRTATSHRYGILLSGGLDSRLILATAREMDLPVRAFTYGTPHCRDVAFARSCCRRTGTPQHESLFESGAWVRDVADRHLELTENQQCVMHAHGLHMAHEMRDLVDVNLSGYVGGLVLGGTKILRSVPHGGDDWSSMADHLHAHSLKSCGMGFVDPRDLRGLFTEAVWNHPDRRPLRDSLSVAVEEFRGSRVEEVSPLFAMLQRNRRLLVHYLTFARPYFEDRTPFCDDDLFDLCFALPARFRAHARLQQAVLERVSPSLAGVRWQRTNRPPTRRRGPRRAWKVERTIRRALRALTRGRVCPVRPRQDTEYDLWFRRDLMDWAREILLDRRTLERGIFDPAFVRSRVEPPIPEERRWAWQAGQMLSFEMMARRLIDSRAG